MHKYYAYAYLGLGYAYDRLNLRRPKFPEAITFEPLVQITHNAHISDYNISI